MWICRNFNWNFPHYLSVLPERPVILDRFGVQLNGTTIGPIEEGDDMTLVCRVIGGKWSVLNHNNAPTLGKQGPVYR